MTAARLAALLAAMSLCSCKVLEHAAHGDSKAMFNAIQNTSAEDVANDVSRTGESLVKNDQLIGAWIKAAEDITPENEHFLGRAFLANTLAGREGQVLDLEAVRAGKLAGATAYLNKLGFVLAAAAMTRAGDADGHFPLTGWHFVILNDKVPNAFAAPGGFVVVTTGLILSLKSEEELAAVLAHEISHVLLGHGIEAVKDGRRKEAMVATGMLTTEIAADQFNQRSEHLKVDPGQMRFFHDLLGTLGDAMMNGYSRDMEYAADLEGSRTLQAAGYDPAAMISVLRRLQELQKTRPEAYRTTHASPRDRMEHLFGENEATKAIAAGKPQRARRFSEMQSVLPKG